MRAVFAKLADTSHTLPMPGQVGRFFNPAGETIDADDPFWINLFADGSIVEAQPELPAKAADKPAAKASA